MGADHHPGAAAEWYADGLRFECTMCGECCTGPTGFVAFTETEGREMAASLGVGEDEFYRRYAHRMRHGKRGWSLNEVKTEHGYDCVFLDRESEPGKALCRVHRARPMQCRTWPWWPENLKSKRAWAQAAKRCEGMNQGPIVRVEDIRIERDRTPK